MREDKGVSAVLGASLVLAVLIVCYLLFYFSYSQHLLQVTEAQHVESVRRAIIRLKSLVEGLSPGEGVTVGIPMSHEPGKNIIPFLPVVVSVPGTLASGLEFDNSCGGRLIFRTHNLQYPNEEFVYENGAVLSLQREGSAIISEPAWLGVRENEPITHLIQVAGAAEWVTRNRIVLSHEIFLLTGENWAAVATGVLSVLATEENCYYECPFDGRIFDNREAYEAHMASVHTWPLDSITIRFNTQYENAWYEYLITENAWLAGKGYNPALSGSPLALTILGPFVETTDLNGTPIRDIYYYRRVHVVRIKVEK
jgi:hypothetical protein